MGSLVPGGLVDYYSCGTDGSTIQSFYYMSNHVIKNTANSKMCIDLKDRGANAVPGQPLQLWTCDDGDNTARRWTFLAATTTTTTTTTTTQAATQPTWVCARRCGDKGNYIRAHKQGTSVQCVGPDSSACTWCTYASNCFEIYSRRFLIPFLMSQTRTAAAPLWLLTPSTNHPAHPAPTELHALRPRVSLNKQAFIFALGRILADFHLFQPAGAKPPMTP